MIAAYSQTVFDQTPFMLSLGAILCKAEAGQCEIETPIVGALTQHNGFVHAGVQASLADHACGVATASLLEPTHTPLSIEFKINLLRPALGDTLLAKAKVLRCGKTIAVVECDVFAMVQGEPVAQTAKMIATIAIVKVNA